MFDDSFERSVITGGSVIMNRTLFATPNKIIKNIININNNMTCQNYY